MADRFLIAAGGAWIDATSDIWAAGSGGAADGGGIAPGDTAKLDGNSGNLAFGGTDNVCAAFDTTGYTGTATAAAATSYLDAITHAAGTLALSTFTFACGSFAMTGGTLTGSGDIDVGGAISITGGANNHTGTMTQTVSGDVAIGLGLDVAHLVLGSAGVVSNIAANSYANELTIGPGSGGSAVTGAGFTLLLTIEGNDKLHQPSTAGTVACRAFQFSFADDYEIGRIDGSNLADGVKIVAGVTAKTLTMTGPMICGTKWLNIYRGANGFWGKLAMGGNRLTAGAVTLGLAGAFLGGGKLDLGTGAHRIATIAKAALSDAAENDLDFGSCYLELLTSIDMDTITGANTAAHIVAPQGSTPDIKNFPNLGGGEALHCHGVTDDVGAGDPNHAASIDFDKHAHPGSLVMGLCGI